MNHILAVELSDAVYETLAVRAREAAQSLAALAAAALEQHFGIRDRTTSMTETEKQAARERFERHFGAVNLGHATGTDNEAIDADLARAYADNHDED